MNNHLDIYKRSVNLYKITDGEYKDIYVEMYLWLENLNNSLIECDNINKIYKNNISVFKNKYTDKVCIIRDYLSKTFKVNNDNVYLIFENLYHHILSYNDILDIFSDFFEHQVYISYRVYYDDYFTQE